MFDDDIKESDVKPNYYQLSFEKFDNKNGILVTVTELLDSCLENTSIIGYIDYKGNTIYVINYSNYVTVRKNPDTPILTWQVLYRKRVYQI